MSRAFNPNFIHIYNHCATSTNATHRRCNGGQMMKMQQSHRKRTIVWERSLKAVQFTNDVHCIYIRMHSITYGNHKPLSTTHVSCEFEITITRAKNTQIHKRIKAWTIERAHTRCAYRYFIASYDFITKIVFWFAAVLVYRWRDILLVFLSHVLSLFVARALCKPNTLRTTYNPTTLNTTIRSKSSFSSRTSVSPNHTFDSVKSWDLSLSIYQKLKKTETFFLCVFVSH